MRQKITANKNKFLYISYLKLRTGAFGAFVLLSANINNLVLAEEPVGRSGNFSVAVPTPECDDFFDQLQSGSEFLVDGVEYLGEKTLKATQGIAILLVQGDPDALLDEINAVFADAAAAATSLSAYTPMALVSLIVDELPEGSMTSFIQKGLDYEQSIRGAVFGGVVSGLNPITLAKTATTDLSEIAGDLAKVLVNLDDPLSAGNEFLKLNQKWTGMGALTYILTEKDPATGIKKALNAMHRQIELVTTYAGPNSKVGSALLEHSVKESKKYIDSLPAGSEDKKIAALMVASFSVTFQQSLLDPNFNGGEGVTRHPIYKSAKTSVNTNWLGDEHNSGSDYRWGFLHPVVEDKPGCISLGDYAYPERMTTNHLNALCGVESGRNKWWARPIDYKLVWGDNCSGGTHDRSVWQPVCGDGYVGVGFVASGNSSQKPLPNQIACLKNDLNMLSVDDGIKAGLKWVANDAGSGAKYNLTVYNRDFMGLQLMYAVPEDVEKPANPANDIYISSLNVPVPVAGIAPSNGKSDCVNFYTQANFKGWTTEVCGVNQAQALSGVNGQMYNDGGISSFQCGSKVVGVQLYGEKIIDCRDGAYLNDVDNAALIALPLATPLATYISPRSGKPVLSPHMIAEQLAVAQKLERDRLEQVRVAELYETNARYREECEIYDSADHCYALGTQYAMGTETIAQDYTEAMSLLLKACEQSGNKAWACDTYKKIGTEACAADNGIACTRTGEIDHLGLGATNGSSKDDKSAAKELYRQGCYIAAAPDGRACSRYADFLGFGYVLSDSEVGTIDVGGALAAWLRACELSYPYGCERVAQAYQSDNTLVTKNLDVAIDFWHSACLIEGEDRLCSNEKEAIAQREREAITALTDKIALEADGDSDNDGLPDVWEKINNLNPLDPSDASIDNDNDGLNNLEEFANGTSPNSADSDGDSILDGEDKPEATSCPNTSTGSVKSDLTIYAPALDFQTALGSQQIWAELSFSGQESNGDYYWKLKEYGTVENCNLISIGSVGLNYDIQFNSLMNEKLFAALNISGTLEFATEKSPELMWRLNTANEQCAIFNNNQLTIPCVNVSGVPYSAQLSVSNADPLQFNIVGAGLLSQPLASCATYEVSSSLVDFPCVQVGEQTLWAKLKLIQKQPEVFGLDSFGVK